MGTLLPMSMASCTDSIQLLVSIPVLDSDHRYLSLGRSITASRSKHHRGRGHLFHRRPLRRLAYASFHNQKPNSAYLNFGRLVGPISLDDPDRHRNLW